MLGVLGQRLLVLAPWVGRRFVDGTRLPSFAQRGLGRLRGTCATARGVGCEAVGGRPTRSVQLALRRCRGARRARRGVGRGSTTRDAQRIVVGPAMLAGRGRAFGSGWRLVLVVLPCLPARTLVLLGLRRGGG